VDRDKDKIGNWINSGRALVESGEDEEDGGSSGEIEEIKEIEDSEDSKDSEDSSERSQEGAVWIESSPVGSGSGLVVGSSPPEFDLGGSRQSQEGDMWLLRNVKASS
jgi:hypothetical protein